MEEHYKKVKLVLERLGFDMAKFEKGELDINEKAIVESVIANEANLKPKIEEAIKKHDGIISSKLNKEAIALGIDKDKVEGAGGDIKKLFGIVSDYQKEALGKTDDEKTKKLEEFQTKLREQELAFKAKELEYQTAQQAKDKEYQDAQARQSMSFAIKSGMMGVGLVDDVAKNLDFYHTALESKLLGQFDFKNENGKMLAYKKGSTDKVFVDGKAEHADLNHIIAQTASEMKWKKVTDVAGGGDPGKGGQAPPKDPDIVDRYAGMLN